MNVPTYLENARAVDIEAGTTVQYWLKLQALVRRNLSRIFTFRQTALTAIFANGSSQQAAP